MPTRHATENSPLAFERHLSSPIYSDRRPIPANIVAEKAIGYRSPADRRLLFFLQALSVKEGGLRAAAADLMGRFPNVLEGASECLAPAIAKEFDRRRWMAYLESATFDDAEMLQTALVELCTNPELDLEALRGEPGRNSGLLPAIDEYRSQLAAEEKARVVTTSLGVEVCDLLDQAASLGGITITEAPSGSGKTFSAESWCRVHLGDAYFVTLSGITTRTNLMQKIAIALGMATCQRKASELQAKIEAFFLRTKALLVIDEAHFLWPQSKRITSNPELIDWIDTLVNMGARIALICTDQFARQKDRVEKQTAWTSDQFKHRVRDHRILDGRATLADLEAVAFHLLSFANDAESCSWTRKLDGKPDADAVGMVVHSANKSELPLSRVRALVERARFFAHDRNGRELVSLRDIISALEGQDRSELALNSIPRPPGRRSDTAADAAVSEALSAPPRTEQMSRLSAVPPAASSRRRRRSSVA